QLSAEAARRRAVRAASIFPREVLPGGVERSSQRGIRLRAHPEEPIEEAFSGGAFEGPDAALQRRRADAVDGIAALVQPAVSDARRRRQRRERAARAGFRRHQTGTIVLIPIREVRALVRAAGARLAADHDLDVAVVVVSRS